MLNIGKTHYYLETGKFLNYNPEEWKFVNAEANEAGELLNEFSEDLTKYIVECVVESVITKENETIAGINVNGTELQRDVCFVYEDKDECIANAKSDLEDIKKRILRDKFIPEFNKELVSVELDIAQRSKLVEIIENKEVLLEELALVKSTLLQDYIKSITDYITKQAEWVEAQIKFLSEQKEKRDALLSVIDKATKLL